MKHMDLATCMDIFDWFDDGLYEYISHILLSKTDGEARVQRAMPGLREHASDLLAAHRHTVAAYPNPSARAVFIKRIANNRLTFSSSRVMNVMLRKRLRALKSKEETK